MALDPNSSLPPYRQIIADIASKIEDGTWPPGHKLPSRLALSTRYGVAPFTVHQALRVLKERGLLVGRQGQGVFVRTDIPQ